MSESSPAFAKYLPASPSEGEAAMAAQLLQKLLTQYNLDIADLERKGAAKPGVKEEGHDLGKAAFAWKLDLAEAIADHYFCASIINRRAKTVHFVGRPDNVASLRMLYAWLIDQIRRIAADKRREHQAETGEHIDPLRWQVNFGVGAVRRLAERLRELAERRAADAKKTALVMCHRAEVSDYLEQTYGYRVDGKKTKQEQKWEEEWAARQAAKAELKKNDLEAYYRAYPYEAELDRQRAEAVRKWEARERRNAKCRKGRRIRRMSEKEWQQLQQGETARRSGVAAGDEINLTPFLGKDDTTERPQID